MDTAQNQIAQPQLTGGLFRPVTNTSVGAGVNGVVIGANTTNDNTQIFDTLVNSIFSPALSKECATTPYMNSCTASRELPCFFEFLRGCSPQQEADLVYGLYCMKHTHDSNRTFVPIGNQHSVNLEPVYLRPAKSEKNIFLWSFLTNVSYVKARELSAFMNLSTIDASKISKFIMTLSEPQNNRDNSADYQILSQYLSAYCQHAIKCIETIQDREKLSIPMYLSENFFERNKRNRIVNEIKTQMSTNQISHEKIDGYYMVYVPLTMLNILDQIQLLSFRMYSGPSRSTLAANVTVYGERVVIGCGLGINNTLSPVDIKTLRSNHPEKLYQIIKRIHGDSVQINLDILVLLSVPSQMNSIVKPQIFVAQRIFLSIHFEIDKLDVVTFCG